MNAYTKESLKEFASYIPLRLSHQERRLLTVLESALHVSEYTDNVDVASNRYGGSVRVGGGKVKLILDGILELCHVATGLASAGRLDHPRSLMDCMMMNHSSTAFWNDSTSHPSSSASSLNGLKHHRKDVTVATSTGMSKKEKQAAKALRKEEKKRKKLNAQRGLLATRELLSEDQRNESSEQFKIIRNSAELTSDETENGLESAQHPPQASSPYEDNLSSIASLTPAKNALFFQTIFEIGRRNKVLNPSKMRSTYGKLMHLLQDAQSPSIAKSLGFSLYKDLVMVRPFLQAKGADGILEDERLLGATRYVSVRDEYSGEAIERHIIERQVQEKKNLLQELLNDYSLNESCDALNDNAMSNSKLNPSISREDLLRCIESISDAIALVESNVAPVQRMIRLLEENFSPEKYENPFSLELRGGSIGKSFSSSYYGYGFGAFGSSFGSRDSSGPTLSHSHSTQYTFVWQSLTLWKNVQRNMHRLWVCADDDLLSTTTSYQLLNTGQGLNRVQSCPKVARLMSNLLHKTQQAAGSSWVGLSVIHLGDRDVPNALVFIDKYTQIPRILKPIADFCDGIDQLIENEQIAKYVENEFGSERNLKMFVLSDYFKHGFDGSGDDGGSCIDGRLTSSWNWTSRISKKNYYHAFMMAGFQGFDGDFK